MNRQVLHLAVITASLLTCDVAFSQTARQLERDRLRGSLDVLNARIGEQRVQRQSEILRLEQMMESFGNRMIRLEREMLGMSRLPAITMAESQAALKFAQAQLDETEQLHADGQASDVTLARHRLELIRAEGQVQAAQTVHADRLLALELDVLYAERDLLDSSNEQRQLERMVAKGYSSAAGLKWRSFDVSIAEKRLQLARLRLEAQRRASGGQTAVQLLDLESTDTEVDAEVESNQTTDQAVDVEDE